MLPTIYEMEKDIEQQFSTNQQDDADRFDSNDRNYHDEAPLLEIHQSPGLMSMENTSTHERTIVSQAIEFFRPSLFKPKKVQKLKPTACLDGLRGTAALVVYMAHSQAWKHDNDIIQLGFGYSGPLTNDKPNLTLITFPFLRVFITGGAAAVAVFFVISGYVLSRRPIELVHRRSDEVYATLSSAVFRRAIRLYIPLVGVTIAWFTIWHLFSVEIAYPKPQPTYLKEIANWWAEFSQYVNPLRKPGYQWFTYDFPLWTIPVEYQGSILIFTTLLSFARLASTARLALTLIMALYFLHIGVWQSSCFLCGLILAELDVLTETRKLQLPSVITQYKQTWLQTIFVLGMYLAGQPSIPDAKIASSTPGWTLLTSLVPKVFIDEQWWRFWLTIAAPMLVFSTSQISFLRKTLERPVPQYLGRISFALYLVHIPIQASVGDVIFRTTGFIRSPAEPSRWDNWFSLPSYGPLGFELDFLLPQLFIFPFTLYVSELVTEALDEPSVWIGRWAYEKCVAW